MHLSWNEYHLLKFNPHTYLLPNWSNISQKKMYSHRLRLSSVNVIFSSKYFHSWLLVNDSPRSITWAIFRWFLNASFSIVQSVFSGIYASRENVTVICVCKTKASALRFYKVFSLTKQSELRRYYWWHSLSRLFFSSLWALWLISFPLTIFPSLNLSHFLLQSVFPLFLFHIFFVQLN